ncbi:hypothetical protein CAOG_08420 [Capsaspora owczarzaki ATCC 30864]|uniref:Uncharacterized protein n=1 Tax=Capsaspora owczarzaki (strain ATCC 30864) TaxID=595528 RepID=A0A0D2WH94_CAPO3|nr:hypothetical protein CAOG_08420 [Capsaspora owczarzaki ATCC 30864]KJE88950.1 hypothetical protein CAOG_008420 [Capsaspora owczarzaki ATCC 30864]|eukprot:XP_011269991.1 hypothetical protein CAOG_08420 [Capsaspora owczarzaki ATCC 30864]
MTEPQQPTEEAPFVIAPAKDDEDDPIIWRRVGTTMVAAAAAAGSSQPTTANSAAGTATAPTGPSARRYHTAVLHRRKMVVFGGSKASTEMLNDLYTLNLDTLEWTQVEASGTVPTPRGGHSAVVHSGDGKTRMLVFGGISSSKQALHDMYSLDLDSFVWSAVPTTAENWPGPRYQHAVAANDTHMFVHSGAIDLKKYQTDLWQFEFASNTWSPISASNPPEHRAGHFAFLHGLELFIFGGHTADGGFTYLSDLHRLDLSTATWTPLSTQGKIPFTARPVPCITIRDDHVYVFGGYDGATKMPQGDLLTLSLKDFTWKAHELWLDMSQHLRMAAVGSKGTLPTPRYGHAAVFDKDTDTITVHAGSGSMYLADVIQIVLPELSQGEDESAADREPQR